MQSYSRLQQHQACASSSRPPMSGRRLAVQVRAAAVATQKQTLSFKKYQGLGNDFILVRGRACMRGLALAGRLSTLQFLRAAASAAPPPQLPPPPRSKSLIKRGAPTLPSLLPHPSPTRSTTATGPSRSSPPTRPPRSATATLGSAATASSLRCLPSAPPT